MSRPDDLPPAVVAAITAILAAMQEPDDDEPKGRPWARSGRVAPTWNERGNHAWRDAERERGWRA